jgi:4-diphosphocytidyl-2-C-methyl-D-erythritol kinase
LPFTEIAPAKVNLTLRVAPRRADGYHEIESLVAFAREHDALQFLPGGSLGLAVGGETAGAAGPANDNLVLKAANALAGIVPWLRTGRFTLTKNLPVAGGLGGGSSDAAAALRLLAKFNGIASDDHRLHAAAIAAGADVPVCLDPRPRIMRGIGEILTPPIGMPPVHAVLVNPGVAAATRDVFAAFDRLPARPFVLDETPRGFGDADALLGYLETAPNDLEPAATGLHPVIGDVLASLRAQPGCRIARMSGSGATCFGIFDEARAADAARTLHRAQPAWWVKQTLLG